MAAGAAPGQRRGGRQKGTPNAATRTVEEILDRLGCDPFEGMALIAMNLVPCGECRGKGHKRYKLPEILQNQPCPCLKGKKADPKCWMCSGLGIQLASERVCQSCWNDLMERCAPELRGKMYAELAQYKAPKRKAIEHSGTIEVEASKIIEALHRGRERAAGKRSSSV